MDFQAWTAALLAGKPVQIQLETTEQGPSLLLSLPDGQQKSIPLVPPVVLPPEKGPSLPAFPRSMHPLAVPAKVAGLPFPCPTNSWWENVLLGTNRIAPLPYQVSLVDNGYLLCYPNQIESKDGAGMAHSTTQWLQNLSLEIAETASSWKLLSSTLCSITVQWSVPAGQATSIIVQGSPYLSMNYQQTTPLLTSQHAIISFIGANGKWKIGLNNGQIWNLYASAPLTLSRPSPTQIQATTPYTGLLRLAIVLDPAEDVLLDQYAGSLLTGESLLQKEGGYFFNWKSTLPGLVFALPHHLESMQQPQITSLKRKSIKGEMTAILGNSWNMLEPAPGISWRAPRALTPSFLPLLQAQIQKDASFTPSSQKDTYFAGKAVAKLARIVLLAEEVGDTQSQTQALLTLKKVLVSWLTSSLFTYDSTWGGIQFAPAGADKAADFGFNYYNDGHYHLGYFVYALAVVARSDADFLKTYQDKVNALLFHYCNPGNPLYPASRYKDWYAGHSWASGLFDFADNRNQESSSEAINAYYAAVLWGTVIGDSQLVSSANLLLATEIRAARNYWHVYPGNTVYPASYTANGVGMVWSTKVDDSTWFDSHLSCRRGIQVIPLTPITEFYLEPAWIQAMQQSGELALMLKENFGIWPTFVIAMLAVIEKQTAWSLALSLTDAQIDDGCSRSNLLWWIASRP